MTRRAPLLALFAGAALLVPVAGRATLSKDLRNQTMRGVAHLVAADVKGDSLEPISAGSGTILTADGAVLTNHHVVYDNDKKAYHDVVAVGLFQGYADPPDYVCLAKVKDAILKPYLDLALLRCSTDLQGRPYTPAGWPTVPVGRSADVTPGDEITIFGYPGVGGSTIHVTAGRISGFVGAAGGAGRDWM
jgi:S1-C subfamily serine protease